MVAVYREYLMNILTKKRGGGNFMIAGNSASARLLG